MLPTTYYESINFDYLNIFLGKRGKSWKRLVTKVCFVPENFTRKPPKFERFIRPTGLRFKKAHVTHPELRTTFYLPIIGVKRNPSSAMYTQLVSTLSYLKFRFSFWYFKSVLKHTINSNLPYLFKTIEF